MSLIGFQLGIRVFYIVVIWVLLWVLWQSEVNSKGRLEIQKLRYRFQFGKNSRTLDRHQINFLLIRLGWLIVHMYK
jgi:hypothetical protein